LQGLKIRREEIEMADMKKTVEEIAAGAASGFQKLEDGVIGTYQKIENGAVGAYKKVEDAFIGTFLTHDSESIEEAKVRLAQEEAARRNGTGK